MLTSFSDGKTDELIGIPETLITSSICGCLFALFSGQPLVIIGEHFLNSFVLFSSQIRITFIYQRQ